MVGKLLKGVSSTDARISRWNYAIIIIINLLGFIGIGFLAPMIFDPTWVQYSNYTFFLKAPFIAFGLIAAINRFHDMNRSGWYVLLQLIPFVNLGVLLWMLIEKWTAWKNEYWEDPLK